MLFLQFSLGRQIFNSVCHIGWYGVFCLANPVYLVVLYAHTRRMSYLFSQTITEAKDIFKYKA